MLPLFSYMDDLVTGQIRAEVNFLKVLYLLSFVCMAGALIGIYATVSLACERRRKEIAVRKINGAGTAALIRLFAGQYVGLLLTVSVVAFTGGTLLMQRWLEQFIIRSGIAIWIYPAVFTVIALVLSGVVVLRVWRSVHLNPVEELRKE